MDKESEEMIDFIPTHGKIDDEHGEELQKTKQCIDKRMLPVKASYLFFFAALGSWRLYKIIFLISVGLSPFQSGLIDSLRTLVCTFILPLWGFLSDYTGKRKIIIMILCFGMTGTVFVAPFVARELNVFDNSNNTLPLNVTSAHEPKRYCSSECGNNKMFSGMLGLFLLMGIFPEFGAAAFLDSNAMNMIKNSKVKRNYGMQRLFGPVGFALASFVAGVAADHFKHETLVNYTAVFFVFLPFCLFGLPFHFFVARETERRESSLKRESDKKKDIPAMKLAKIVLKTCFQFPNLIFLLSILVQGTTMAFKYGYLFLHMKDNMSSSSTVMGLSIVSANVGEIIIFPFTHFIIKKFGSINCFIFTIFTNAVRFLLLAYITDAWWTIPVELLHCFGFALSYSSIIETVSKISPKEITDTMFSVQITLNFMLGSVIGSSLGGYIYGIYGGKISFIICAVINGVWAIIVALIFFVLSKKKKQ